MTSHWKVAVAGGLGGTVLAVAIVFGLVNTGILRTGGDEAIHNYLIAHPEVLIEMSNRLQVQQQQAEDAARQAAVDKLGLKAFFNPKIAFITGPKNAKHTFVEFSDYNCPFCRASNPTVETFYRKHKNDTRFAFIEFPIKGMNSIAVARLALAARKQPDKYLEYHFALMRESAEADPAAAVAIAKEVGLNLKKLQADERDPSIEATIAAGRALGDAANIDGTPAFIINGTIREGTLTDTALNAVLKSKTTHAGPDRS